MLLFVNVNFTCNAQENYLYKNKPIETGADQSEKYLPMLRNKKVGILTNQTGIITLEKKNPSKQHLTEKQTLENTFIHLVDYLIEKEIKITKIYAPEHGFRGTADAGELIKDGNDVKTGLPIVSLYGNNKKPTVKQLEGIEIMVFDLQDVGARFYTYISSLHYLMEACAEQNIPIIILDRPNPKGAAVDGPILEIEHKSFVGMHPIPILHGLTIGEYAQMINGEKWLKNGITAKLTVIKVKNYNKGQNYHLPVKPSPNLPNDTAVNLYTSLCLFEGTNVSVGRGTEKQFQVYGSPFLKNMPFTFSPKPNEGAKDPLYNSKKCFGEDLSNNANITGLSLEWLLNAYKNTTEQPKFFNSFFLKLAGTNKLQQQIEKGLSEEEIKKSWKTGLEAFRKTREKYLLYSDF